VKKDVGYKTCDDDGCVETVEFGVEIAPPKSPNTKNQFHHEQTTKYQARNPQSFSNIVPFRPGEIALVALVEVYDDICEDAEEIEGYEGEDGVVLCGGGEE